MSPRDAKPGQPAFVEDVDEVQGTALPDTKVTASANTKVKRSSKESFDEDDDDDGDTAVAEGTSGGSIADSGYSSQAATVSSKGSGNRGDYRRALVLGVNSTRNKAEDKRKVETRSDRTRRQSLSHETSSRSKPGSTREPAAVDKPKHQEGRTDKRPHRQSIGIPKEARSTTPQLQARPRLERSQSTSQRTRPASADFTGIAMHSIYQYAPPPSAWTYHASPYIPQQLVQPATQPIYNMGLPRTAQPVYPPNHQVYEQLMSRPQPVLRRQTVNYGQPVMHHPTAANPVPTVYSMEPIPDAAQPRRKYPQQNNEEILQRRLREEHARRVSEEKRRKEAERQVERISREEKATRRDTQPSRRQSVSRSRTREAEVHNGRPRGLSRQSSDSDPPPPTIVRPSNRSNNSYAGTSNRRNSSVYPLQRSTTIDGHERNHELERKLQAAEKYQQKKDIKPRMELTPESVHRKSPRAPSNASHRSRTSKESGHKSSSSRGKEGLTLYTDQFRISIPDPKNKEFSIKSSEDGVRLLVEDEQGNPARSVFISREADDRPSRGSRSVVSGTSRRSGRSERSERSRK